MVASCGYHEPCLRGGRAACHRWVYLGVWDWRTGPPAQNGPTREGGGVGQEGQPPTESDTPPGQGPGPRRAGWVRGREGPAPGRVRAGLCPALSSNTCVRPHTQHTHTLTHSHTLADSLPSHHTHTRAHTHIHTHSHTACFHTTHTYTRTLTHTHTHSHTACPHTTHAPFPHLLSETTLFRARWAAVGRSRPPGSCPRGALEGPRRSVRAGGAASASTCRARPSGPRSPVSGVYVHATAPASRPGRTCPGGGPLATDAPCSEASFAPHGHPGGGPWLCSEDLTFPRPHAAETTSFFLIEDK